MDSRRPLPQGAIIGQCLQIVRAIGSGGFGITYLAEDLNLATSVAVKEYFPEDFAVRDDREWVLPQKDHAAFDFCRASFMSEAKIIAKCEHPSIVKVMRAFEENGTAYMVMRYEQGPSFEQWLGELGRRPSQIELDCIFDALLSAIDLMHQRNFVHRDIAPDNIIIREAGPILLDFGAAHRTSGEKAEPINGFVKEPFSPWEQYLSEGSKQGPWSDFYALGATFYFALTGQRPPSGEARHTTNQAVSVLDQEGDFRREFLLAIDKCLQVQPVDRPQSVAELKRIAIPAALDSESIAEIQGATTKPPEMGATPSSATATSPTAKSAPLHEIVRQSAQKLISRPGKGQGGGSADEHASPTPPSALVQAVQGAAERLHPEHRAAASNFLLLFLSGVGLGVALLVALLSIQLFSVH